MPGGDRTGPMGQGPMTGRRAGYCGGSAVPGYASGGFGRGGAGRGRGGQFGRRNRFHATGLTGWQRAAGVGQAVPPVGASEPVPPVETTSDRTQELEILKRQAEQLADTLEQITGRIDELRSEQSS